MTHILSEQHRIIEDTLFKPANIAAFDLQQLIFNNLHHRIDFADIYLQNSLSESWVLEDGHVKRGHFSINRGAGIRIISDEKTGFAYCDEINFQAIQQALHAAKSISQHGELTTHHVMQRATSPLLYPAINPIESMDSLEKIQLLHELDSLVR